MQHSVSFLIKIHAEYRQLGSYFHFYAPRLQIALPLSLEKGNMRLQPWQVVIAVSEAIIQVAIYCFRFSYRLEWGGFRARLAERTASRLHIFVMFDHRDFSQQPKFRRARITLPNNCIYSRIMIQKANKNPRKIIGRLVTNFLGDTRKISDRHRQFMACSLQSN